MFALAVFLIGLAVIADLWSRGHPAILDRGEGQPRAFLDGHSKYHLLGALIVALGVAYVDGPIWGFLVSAALWSMVEVAQKNPHDGLGGYAEPSDFVMDGIGAVLGALLGAFLS